MLFLSEQEKKIWEDYAHLILNNKISPDQFEGKIRNNLIPAFNFYVGSFLAIKGPDWLSGEWLKAGKTSEKADNFLAGFLTGFLERYNGKFIKPTITFKDPRSFIHFANIPLMVDARHKIVLQFANSLPDFDNEISFLDIGCGDGDLTIKVLSQLLKSGKVPGISEILLIDPSPAMIELALMNVNTAFPGTSVKTENTKIQDCSTTIDHVYDIAMSSFAYHHMPSEDKHLHLTWIKPWINHFLLFEIEADIDIPEMYSPELALSVYQTYGRIIYLISVHGAPIEVVTDCIDSIFMTELVSILSEPRGVRTDYHMLRTQWMDLFSNVFGEDFSLRSDLTCYADEYLSLFALHYGRE